MTPEGLKRKEVAQVTKAEYDDAKEKYQNALNYEKVQEEGNEENSRIDYKKNMTSKEFVLSEISRGGHEMRFRDVSPELRADKEVVLAAVRSRGEDFQYASPELRDDIDVVIEAVQHTYWPDRVRNFVSTRLSKDPRITKAIAEKIIKEDREERS